MPDAPNPALPVETQILVAIASLDGKVTGALTSIDSLRGVDSDHEARLRKLEERHYITPAQLWGGLLGLASVAGAVATVIAVWPHS